jgi:branched-chain amino acid transport system ATP-binding protein
LTHPPELLRVSGLSAGYGDVPVLHGVDLEVASGEWVAVIGSNGVGKSTLLKTIAGLLRPRSGAVTWQGRDITSLTAAARVRCGISLVPEGKRLFTGMTVSENLAMGAFARSSQPEVKRDLERVFTLFPALGSKAARIAGTLSGGEQQMCSLGRGLMARPALLLVDELSFGLSPALTSQLLEAMAGIVKGGVAVVLVEQDVLAALKHAHRGYVIGSGQVLRQGTASALMADSAIRKAYLGV